MDKLPDRRHTVRCRGYGGWDELPMRIAGRPLFWFIIALLVFLFWRAPQAMSAVLGALGHAFVAIGDGFAAFFSALTHKPL